MENPKYISVKVFGNPDSHSGAEKVGFILCNNAKFDFKEPTYAGFQDNSFYFSISIESDCIVFKLIKNNVRSFNSVREGGRLVFGISVPKGYAIAGGLSPYDALMEIKDKFIGEYMTLKDPLKETYEYNEGIMTSSKLNEITTELDTVARKYVLEAKSGPYRQMTPGGPTAYVTATQDDIRKLMADVQYAEFEPYGEVLVAEKADKAPYDKLDIQIPRPRNYTVYVNGRSFDTVTDVDKELQFNSGKNANYYDNESVTFTIRELENGKKINGVQINIDEEKIYVTVNASPKKKKISICLNRIDNNTVIFNNQPAFSLTYGADPITVKSDHNGSQYFILTGEKIGWLLRPDGFTVYFNDKEKYQNESVSLENDVLTVAYSKKQQQTVTSGSKKGHTENSQEAGRTVKFVFYEETFEDRFPNFQDPLNPLTAKVKCGDKLLKTTIQFSKTREKKSKKEFILQSIVLLPSDWYGPISVEITDGKTTYVTKQLVDFYNKETIVQFDNLEKKKAKGGISRPVLAGLALLIGLAVGFAIGNCTGWWSGGKASDPQDNSNPQKTETTQDGDTEKGGDDGTDKAKASERMKYFKDVLNNDNKDLSFAQVAEIYTEYSPDAEAFKQVDADFCKVIESYHKVQEAFDNMDVDSLVKFIEYGNQEIKLFEQHRLPVAKYFQGNDNEGRRTYFITNKERIKTFADFNRLDEGWKNGRKETAQQTQQRRNNRNHNKNQGRTVQNNNIIRSTGEER